ncbi:MAG: LptF/LptG family permease [Carboxylicivirga sp.]|jgi:lipopolysaccharide export system permease protein|nr:LptF/LptG family permease [Carboxylicivirga sp.]
MKKLHIFILKSYLGPLTATFFISVFILLLQLLWRFIDILVGKGLETSTLLELLFYALLQVIPMALPLAVLLASLMTFGNMGENYELTAIKASGVSLFRAMKPLIILTIFISISTYGYSNNIMPWANLKFHTLIYSIQIHKPHAEIKAGEFNTIDTYSIKVDKKDHKTGDLYGVMIYDHSNKKNPNSNVTLAKSGSIKTDKGTNMIRLTLYDGLCHEENVKKQESALSLLDQQQYRYDTFKKQIVLHDSGNKQFSKIDEAGYANHNKMKNLQQLNDGIQEYHKKHAALAKEVKANQLAQFKHISSNNLTGKSITPNPVSTRQKIAAIALAKRKVQDKILNLNERILQLKRLKTQEIRHLIEVHRKFTLPFTCFIFFFIGSSLGAIVRKGGLGMPVVLAIVFFIIYYLLDNFGAKMASEGELPVPMGMWFSSAILFITSVFLTYQSTTDSNLLNTDSLNAIINKLLKRNKYNLQNSLDE